nr:MAG TPA: hypothetical protein [Caudoviricetes sp.]
MKATIKLVCRNAKNIKIKIVADTSYFGDYEEMINEIIGTNWKRVPDDFLTEVERANFIYYVKGV